MISQTKIRYYFHVSPIKLKKENTVKMADEAAFLASKNILNNTIQKISLKNIFTSVKNKTIL